MQRARRGRRFGARSVLLVAATLVAAGLVAAGPQARPAEAVSHGAVVTRPAASQPWVVALFYASAVGSPSSAGRFLCSGTLVAPQVVVTAAHCVRGFVAGDLWVQVGANRLGAGRRVAVDGAWWNPRYTSHAPGNDVAVLHLLLPSGVTRFAVLAGSRTAGVGVSYLYGWGEDERGRLGNTLRTTRVVDLDRSGRAVFGRLFDVRTMILAGRWLPSLHRFSGACPGDSGGPLVQYAGTRPVLVGITSFGALVCDHAPTVFTRVTAYRSLIVAGIAAATKQAATASLAAPENLAPPQITGTPETGQTLTCDPGRWTANATGFTIDWTTRLQVRRAPTLTLSRDETGFPVSCTVTATSRRGSATARATPVTPPGLPATFGWVDDVPLPLLHGHAEPATTSPAMLPAPAVVAWCVVVDGAPASVDLAVDVSPGASNPLLSAGFDPLTGCYTAPAGLDLRDGYLTLGSLPPGPHSVTVTTTDVLGATATGTRDVTT